MDQIDDDDEKKDQMTDDEDKDIKEKVLAIHIIKEDHFMLLECKLVLKQIPRKETEILREIIEEMKHKLMPIGSIIMWSGDTNKIPIGWALCIDKMEHLILEIDLLLEQVVNIQLEGLEEMINIIIQLQSILIR